MNLSLITVNVMTPASATSLDDRFIALQNQLDFLAKMVSDRFGQAGSAIGEVLKSLQELNLRVTALTDEALDRYALEKLRIKLAESASTLADAVAANTPQDSPAGGTSER